MKSFPFLQYFLIGALFAVCLGFLSMQYVFAETITFSQEGQSISEEKLIYTESELFDLMTPASVKILQHVEGTVTIPSFVIDPENKTVVVDAVKEPTVLENISEDLLGTGFFVSPDGYIITSSYAVSLTASKLVIIDSFIQRAISEAVDGENVEEVIDELFTKEIVDFMLQEISFDLQMSIIVLGFEEDTEEEDEVFNIYDLGFVAEVLFVNDNFYKEGQDVALLKITGEDHPSASLSERENIDLGEKVYLFRSPTTAIIESVNSLVKEDIYNMSLTSGIVVRENTIASSSIYELDLAVSTDLGGSPVFDAAGDILGIALYDASSGFGDSVSMFILPTNSINTLLSLTSTTASASVFHTRIREGLLFAKELKCEETYSSFAVAFGSPSVFVDRSVFDKYIEGCNEMLAIDQKQNGGFSGILNT
ncbi:MAG: trypsin-like peptidase domain-containing protein, partial [Candidatus Pacebacteria bacterium]|nr:trypsin-like peptidase domain-containing protein [Candidatus Paceibacterota bacterium]